MLFIVVVELLSRFYCYGAAHTHHTASVCRVIAIVASIWNQESNHLQNTIKKMTIHKKAKQKNVSTFLPLLSLIFFPRFVPVTEIHMIFFSLIRSDFFPFVMFTNLRVSFSRKTKRIDYSFFVARRPSLPKFEELLNKLISFRLIFILFAYTEI